MTETQTVDLAAWLTRIWDEEERLAKAANVKQDDPVWWVSRVAMSWPQSYTVRSKLDNRPIARVGDVAGDKDSDITGILDGGAVAAHIAYHDPASVLARIAADRKILALHQPYQRIIGLGCETCLGSAVKNKPAPFPGWPCPTLRLLASPYAERDGFQEAWLDD